MGFGVCGKCGGYWCSVGEYVNYCVCKPDKPEPGPAPAPLSRCTWILATTGRCTNPATNGDVCAACEDARDKRRD